MDKEIELEKLKERLLKMPCSLQGCEQCAFGTDCKELSLKIKILKSI